MKLEKWQLAAVAMVIVIALIVIVFWFETLPVAPVWTGPNYIPNQQTSTVLPPDGGNVIACLSNNNCPPGYDCVNGICVVHRPNNRPPPTHGQHG